MILQVALKRPSRFAGQANGSAGLSARAPDSVCPFFGRDHVRSLGRDWGERKACGVGPPGRLIGLKGGPPGAQRQRAWKLYTNHSMGATHRSAPSARAAQSKSRSRLMSKTPMGARRKAKDPVAGGLPGLSKTTQEAQASGRGSSRKTVQRHIGATHQPKLPPWRPASTHLARSGTGSSNFS